MSITTSKEITGEKIQVKEGKLEVPDQPLIPYIEGDGIGPDIWRASQLVFDGAVEKAYGGKKKIAFFEVLAGEKAKESKDNYLPEETLETLNEYIVSIKGPLTTPVGGGFRSLNVSIRQKLNLYACVRPVRYYQGVPSPVKHPEKLDVIICRENTEDVYAGIEWESESPEAKKVLQFLNHELGTSIDEASGVGIKPISPRASENITKKAIEYAISHNKKTVTLVHKGNIMKYTEGAFREWGYATAKKFFSEQTITEKELWDKHEGNLPEGKILVKDRIADSIFQQVLLRPDEYDILITPNLNGDYLSDACAAQVGGLGMAPGANIGDYVAVFEATHGSAPKYTGMDKVNPSSLILSGCMMLEYLGWNEAKEIIENALEKTIMQKRVTYDLERQMEGATKLKCSEYAKAIVENMEPLG